MQVEGSGVHGEVAAGVSGPLALGAIPVELYAVEVGVVEVECLADTMVGGSVKGYVGGEEAVQSVGECCACGVEDGEVVEAGGSGRWRRAAEGLPGVEADVMVVVTGGEEGCGVADALGDFEAEDTLVEGEGAVEVGYAEMDVADAGLGMDGVGLGLGHGSAQGVGRPLVGGGSLALASRATFHLPATFFQKVM